MSQKNKPARIVMQRCGWSGVRPVLRGGATGKGRYLAFPDDPLGELSEEEQIAQLRRRAEELDYAVVGAIIRPTRA